MLVSCNISGRHLRARYFKTDYLLHGVYRNEKKKNKYKTDRTYRTGSFFFFLNKLKNDGKTQRKHVCDRQLAYRKPNTFINHCTVRIEFRSKFVFFFFSFCISEI